MLADAPGTRPLGDQASEWEAWLFGAGRAPTLAQAQRIAAAELSELVDELEPSLDARQRRLLHQVRLAVEAFGAIRAVATVRGGT
jgi:hypothetical protein